MDSRISHTPEGLFLFDLPLGLLLVFVFHNVIRDPLFDNLPSFLQRRVMTFKTFDWNGYFIRHWFVVVWSLLLGAASHLFWDSFTHNHSFFVELLPALRTNVTLFDGSMPAYRVLQHVSTVVGGAVVWAWVMKFPMGPEVKTIRTPYYWVLVICITITIALVRLTLPLDEKVFPQMVVTLIAALVIALTAAPVIIKEKLHV